MIVTILFIITTFMSLGTTTVTPEALWTAWLYDNTTGQMLTLGPPGNPVLSWLLPFQGKLQAPRDVHVSPSGSHLLFSSSETHNTPPVLVVYDVNNQTITHDSGLKVGDTPAELFNVIFDETSGQVAFGYFVPIYGAAPPSTANWEIAIMDYQTGTITNILPVPPSIQEAFADQHVYSIPVIQRFAGGVVEFALIPGGTETIPGVPTFAWDPASDSVTPINHYTSLVAETWLPTGEMIFPAQDERFGLLEHCAGPGAPHTPFNVISVYDPSDQTTNPVFQHENFAPRSAQFVQNGERVLVSECSLIDSQRLLTLIERDGTVVNEFVMPPIVTRIQPTPDGFVYLAVADATLYGSSTPIFLPVLMHVRTIDNSFHQSLLWQGQQDIYALSLVHVGQHVPPPDLYHSWQALKPAATN